jgi:hypothetical protein
MLPLSKKHRVPFSREQAILAEIYLDIRQHLRAKFDVVPQITSFLLRSTFFPVHYSPIVLQFYTAHPKLLSNITDRIKKK